MIGIRKSCFVELKNRALVLRDQPQLNQHASRVRSDNAASLNRRAKVLAYAALKNAVSTLPHTPDIVAEILIGVVHIAVAEIHAPCAA